MKKLISRLSECGRLLQVALDFTKLGDALRIAVEVPRTHAVILEAGTPLIKSRGVTPIRVLKALPGDHIVFADTKTMDTGALEARLAGEAGADAVSVLALAPEETIGEVVDAARDLEIAVYADLIGHPNPLEAVETLRRLGVDVVLLHIGIDVQRKLGKTAEELADLVREASRAFGGPIAVAGGIKPEGVGKLVDAGASIVVIGGGITRAPDPREAALKALEKLNTKC